MIAIIGHACKFKPMVMFLIVWSAVLLGVIFLSPLYFFMRWHVEDLEARRESDLIVSGGRRRVSRRVYRQ